MFDDNLALLHRKGLVPFWVLTFLEHILACVLSLDDGDVFDENTAEEMMADMIALFRVVVVKTV